MWIRNFTELKSSAIDINKMHQASDYQELLTNELANHRSRYVNIDSEKIYHKHVVIISDGYQFEEKQVLLAKLPKDTIIIATNKALAKWNLVGDECPTELKTSIKYFIVNNPFQECNSFLPKKHRYFPRCIASTRTNPTFIETYRGMKYFYTPAKNQYFSGPDFNSSYKIDDYRNPICAAIGLSYIFGAEKILLFCCDDSFDNERAGAEKLENGLWSYPQQLKSSRTIDAKLYWLKEKEIKLGNHSSGPKLNNASYITEESITEFFEEE